MEVSKGRELAYQTLPGTKRPTVVMVPGLHEYTHMDGHKAHCLMRYCSINHYPCVLYDHECTGRSSKFGGNVNDLQFSHWVEDVLAVIENLTEGPVVLVGSSLGGWLSLVAASRLSSRLHSLVLVAPALNYVWPYYHRYKATLAPEVRSRLEAGDPHVITTHQMGDALLKLDFAEDSRRYEVEVSKPDSFDISCPVRIIHGLKDEEIPWTQSLDLAKSIKSEDVDLIYRKDSDHKLETPRDLELFLVTLDRLIRDNPA